VSEKLSLYLFCAKSDALVLEGAAIKAAGKSIKD
jgi:hypothetical protein